MVNISNRTKRELIRLVRIEIYMFEYIYAKPGLIILKNIDVLLLKYLLFHELSTVSLQSSMGGEK